MMSSINHSLNRSSTLARVLTVGFAAALTIGMLMTLASGTVDAKKGTSAATNRKLPVVSRVAPLRDVAIGQELKLTGKNFIKGKNTLVVIFQRPGSKRRFATRADGLSTRTATVIVPDVSPDLVRAKPGQVLDPLANMYRLRVISKIGASKSWTTTSASPSVAVPAGSVLPIDQSPAGDCDGDGIPNGTDTDDDNDLLPDTTETAIGTDVCNADTDSDGVSDYYEYRVAYELNGGPPNPYPGLRPYPNPLVADSGGDFDGDRLSTLEEYQAWQYTGRMDRFYSDANQDSDGNGIMDGAEDEDHDLMPNLTELRGFRSGAGPGGGGDLNWLRYDTDGDSICDGLDDQDHDGNNWPAPGNRTPLANYDCSTPVPNNGPAGTPPSPFGAGDPDPTKVDGDDNPYSNYYEWMIGGADEVSPGAAYDPCLPSGYPTSPYCPAVFNPAPWGP